MLNPRIFAITAAAFALAAASCNGSEPGAVPNANPAQPGQAVASPSPAAASWTQVSERRACEAVDPDRCLGFYGFAVSSDGHYVAGPDESGSKAEGEISQTELAQLADAAHAVTAEPLQGARQCGAPRPVPGVSMSLSVTLADGQTPIVVETRVPEGTCYVGNKDLDETLRSTFDALLQKYYPMPFFNHSEPLATGTWGGEGAVLTENPTDGTLQMDCAHAIFAGAIEVGPDGSFEKDALIATEGGPTPSRARPVIAAKLTGRVQDGMMDLTVSWTAPDRTEQRSDFTLALGAEGHLVRCE